MDDMDRERQELVDELWTSVETIVATKMLTALRIEDFEERVTALATLLAATTFVLRGHARCIERVYEGLGLPDACSEIADAAIEKADKSWDDGEGAKLVFVMAGGQA